MGRYPQGKVRRDLPCQVKVSDDEHTLLYKAAQERKTSVPELFRQAVFTMLRSPTYQVKIVLEGTTYFLSVDEAEALKHNIERQMRRF